MRKKKKKTGKKGNGIFNKKSLTNRISGIISNNPNQSYNYKQIAGRLGIKDSPTKKLINEILSELRAGKLLEEVHP
ncbi:MAG: hypothetical protein KAT40_04015, partial [Bacteroidales bacterium]|nr:hypothetical protein [Bacteroidales bacterium]